MSKELTESVLQQLATEALVAFYAQSEKGESLVYPGASLTLSNEPVADLNYVVAGRGATAGDRFRTICRIPLSRNQPFLAMLFPEAVDEAGPVAEQLGMVYAVDFPIMVHEDAAIEPGGNDTIEVRRSEGPDGVEAYTAVLSAAFSIPEDSVRRAMPASLVESPALDIYLAFEGKRPVGTVTLTHHGDTTGVWAMGTDTSQQKRGIGRRLLSSAMAEARAAGARRFFLGATPAGYRLYEGLGFRTRCTAKIYAAGETNQA